MRMIAAYLGIGYLGIGYLGIGYMMFLLIKHLNLPCPGLITTFLSAVILASLMLGLLLGAFHE